MRKLLPTPWTERFVPRSGRARRSAYQCYSAGGASRQRVQELGFQSPTRKDEQPVVFASPGETPPASAASASGCLRIPRLYAACDFGAGSRRWDREKNKLQFYKVFPGKNADHDGDRIREVNGDTLKLVHVAPILTASRREREYGRRRVCRASLAPI